ncbi:MAG: pantetheine-phosphate adenylyltransferase [Alphaproteobacteria bacterium]
MQRKGVYPGTFDPVTQGHLDIIQRALNLFETLVVGVAENIPKQPFFSLQERVAFLEQEIQTLPSQDRQRVQVRPFAGLLVHFVKDQEADVIVRGLRALTDFEYEFQMAWLNARLQQGIETVFLMASERYQYVSSRVIKEIACLGGDISPFVSPAIAAAVQQRCLSKKV